MPTCACVEPAAGTLEFHPEMIPASLEKMNAAEPLAAPFFMTNAVLPALFQTAPVGFPPGIETTSDGIVFVAALYRLEIPLPLSAIHHGDVGLDVSPHALTR